MLKMKNCPFCGSNNITVGDRDVYNAVMEDVGCVGSVIEVQCKDCDSEVKCYTQDETYDEAVNLVISKWNKRVPRRRN